MKEINLWTLNEKKRKENNKEIILKSFINKTEIEKKAATILITKYNGSTRIVTKKHVM